MLLVSPITWDHYFLLLLLPLALLWKNLPSSAPGRWTFLVILALMWCSRWRIQRLPDLLLGRDFAMPSGPVYTLTVVSAHFYALAGLFGLVFLTLRRLEAAGEGREGPASVRFPAESAISWSVSIR